MTARYLRLEEVRVTLGVDDEFVHRVCDEGLVEVKRTVDEEALISPEEAERLRVIAVLMRELEVNLAGAEVILHMRDELCAMQRQFDEVLGTLVEELRRRMLR
jgi:MerR family transcriptional regulator/heat shock protein HspR